MAYKVFISHSSRDMGLVISLANLLTKFGIEAKVAEWSLSPGEDLSKKVVKQIKDADCLVVLLTRNGIRSNWVRQEVSYAISSNKRVIPLVEEKVNSVALAALQGKEYIEYDPGNVGEALVKASEYVKSQKMKKEDEENALLVTGGILAFLLLLSGERK